MGQRFDVLRICRVGIAHLIFLFSERLWGYERGSFLVNRSRFFPRRSGLGETLQNRVELSIQHTPFFLRNVNFKRSG